LETRLKERHEDDEAIQASLKEFHDDSAFMEKEPTFFDAVIVNEELEKCYADLCTALSVDKRAVPTYVKVEKIRHILVPIKPTRLESRLAVNHALIFAKLLECKLKLLAVTDKESDELKGYVEKIVGEFGEEMIDYVVRSGHAEDVIIEESQSVELVIMGTAGKDDFENVVLGSTAERVIQKSAVPVITIRGRHLEAVPANLDYNKWLVTHDGSVESKNAFLAMMPLAKKLHAELTIMHVVTTDAAEHNIKQEKELQRASAVLNRAKKLCEVAGVKATTAMVTMTDDIPHTILRASRVGKYELIAISSTKIGKVFADSVTEQIVRRSALPVLTLNKISTH